MKHFLTSLSLLITSLCSEPAIAVVGETDNSNLTYTNPILHADYSDPDVCAVGNDYYLTSSSFNCIPGLPILHSTDLVNWHIINYALPEQHPGEGFDTPQHGKGVWAPCIRYHRGEFYIYWGDPDYGIYMVKTHDPATPWTAPVLVKAGKGMIDPSPLFDDDGRVYLVHAYAGSRGGINSILVVSEMNAEGTAVIGNEVLVFDGNDGVNHTVEGPKFYKRNEYYYIFAPAGGVAHGWQLALRSRNVYGPYEVKRVMEQGNTPINGPHQGGWIDTPEGESWFLHFQDKGAYGRVVHLNPLQWKNDWPVIGIDRDSDGCGEPVLTYRKPKTSRPGTIEALPASDEFNTRTLGLQWQWHANYRDTYGFTSDLGYMRLYSHYLSPGFVNFWEVPNLLLQKFPAAEFTATAKVTFSAKEDGERGGLIVMGWDYACLSLVKQGDRFVLRQTFCYNAEQGSAEKHTDLTTFPADELIRAGHPTAKKTLYLRVKVSEGGICTFAYSTDNKKYHPCDTPFTARQGKWIGAKVGLFSVTPKAGSSKGWLDADWFRVE